MTTDYWRHLRLLSDAELCEAIERACALTSSLHDAGADTSTSEAFEDALFVEHDRRAKVDR